VKSLLLLIVCGLSQGLSSFSQKWFVYKSECTVASFNFYTYIFATAVLLVSYLILNCKKNEAEYGKEEKFSLKSVIVYVAVMAVMLFFSSYFSTLAATKLNAVILYPLSTGISLILSTAMSAIFFGEKPNFKSIVGVIIAFVSIILMNFL
jgi:drug/metabolite transporter (DMT)-like permease